MANTAHMAIGQRSRLLAAHWVWLLLVLPLTEATIGEDGLCNLFIFVPFTHGYVRYRYSVTWKIGTDWMGCNCAFSTLVLSHNDLAASIDIQQ
jgi:hypothetical protein